MDLIPVHAEIGAVLGLTEAGSRQLLARARRRVAADPARQPIPPPEMHRRLVASLRAAFDTGDAASLVGLLREDAVLLADTGGELPAPRGPIVGSAKILRFLALVAAEHPPFTATEVEVNGEPGLLFHAGREPHYLWTTLVDAEGKVRLVLDVGGPTKFADAKRQQLRLPA